MTSPIGRSSGGGSNNFGMSNKAVAIMLRSKGVPEAEITKFIGQGQASPNITKILSPSQIQQVSGGIPTRPGQVAGTPISRPTADRLGLNGNKIGGQATTKAGGDIYRAMQSAGASRVGGIPLSQSQSAQLNGAKKAPGAPSSNVGNRQNLLNRISDALNLRNKVVGGINGALQAGKVNNTGYAGDDKVDFGYPDEFPTGGPAESYTAPEISMRDFTGEANFLAEQAYGPLFQAIAQDKTNAQSQYGQSDQVVKGLYDKLVSDIQASGVQQGQQYDQASAEAAARAKALQDRQGQVYGESANTQTALLERLGQQQSAPQVISGGLQEQAFQQSQAATQGDAQQQYYQAGKQNSNDYTTGIANAQNTQGTVAREGLVRDLASVLSSFDQQALSGKSQQANTALDLANQLSSRDLQVQTANAGNQMGAAQLNQSAQAQALAAQQAAYQNAYGQQRDQRTDFESDRNYELQDSQFRLEQAAAQAKANAALGGGPGAFIPIGEDGFNSQSAPQQIAAQANSIDPGKGQEYIGLFNKVVKNLNGNLNFSKSDFARMASELAARSGLSPAAAYAAGVTYWTQVMNRE